MSDVFGPEFSERKWLDRLGDIVKGVGNRGHSAAAHATSSNQTRSNQTRAGTPRVQPDSGQGEEWGEPPVGAACRNRTDDLFITSESLYRLI